jgi:PAS domain S-box-containing protein
VRLVLDGDRKEGGARVNPIGILDILSFMTVLIGLVAFLVRGRAFNRDIRFIFIGLLALTLFRNFSNVLEWTEITEKVGLYEEYVEILTPLFWVFFFYAFLRHNVEEEQKNALDRFRTVMDSLDALVYVADMNTYEILFINRYGRDTFGDVEGKICWQALQSGQNGPCDFCTNDKLLNDRGEPKGIYAWEFRSTVNDQWYDCRDEAIRWTDGRLVRMEIATDITDRKRAEQALQESEDRYKTLVENSPTCIYVRQGGRFRFVNKRMIELSGYSREELLNMPIFDIIHPEDRQRAQQQVARRDAGHRPSEILQYRIVTKTGDLLWAESFGGIQVDYEGKPAVMSSFIEISDRKRAEQQLEESEERYRVLVENSLTGVYILQDDKFHFVSNRLAEMLGYTSEDLMTLSVQQIIHPEDLERAREMAAKGLSGSSPFRPQMRLITKTGETCWVQIYASVIEHMGRPALLGNVIDITEQKKIEEERSKLEKQIQHTQKLESLGILAGGIAHDFNNLLTSILGHADLARMKMSTASPIIENLSEIETASKRAAELCSQMLAYAGKGKFVIEAVNLNEVVKEMAHLLEISISKKVILNLNLAENIPAIEADATQIGQVIMNLITNASEAIGESSGVISLSTGAMECDRDDMKDMYLAENLEKGVFVYIEISDSGAGMNAETISKIFDPFFTTKFTGRGLGLAAVQGIARGHSGAIRVHSEPGKGTTFKVFFPALDLPSRPVQKESLEFAEWQGSGTVLLVDDEETVRTVGKTMLETMGFEVLLAADGREAVEIFREHPDKITLVLLDLTMPRMGGEEAFREIRSIKSDAIVILSSGYNEQEATNRFADRGLAGFVHKPYQYRALMEKVRSALTY